jgi:hypothetical protein
MAMAGGAKVEVLAYGEANFENEKKLIHFRHFRHFRTLEHFRHTEGDGLMKCPLKGQIKAWSSRPAFFTRYL